jgi:hypothetical protein
MPARRASRDIAPTRVGPEHIAQHRRVDRRLHRRRAARRRPAGRLGPGPLMSSINASTGRWRASRPNTRSTGWGPSPPLRSSTPPSRSSNWTGVPTESPSRARTSAGRVTCPFVETTLLTLTWWGARSLTSISLPLSVA